MIGPEDLATAIVDYLTDAVPDRLTAIRAELDVDTTALPDPALIVDQERDLLTLADWPALFVVVQRMIGMAREDGPADDGTTLYVVRYPVRVFTFVRGQSYEATDRLRKRYVRAVREALLLGAETVRLDELSLVESYSDVGLDDRKRTIAGAWHEVTAEVTETSPAPAAALDAPDPDGWDLTTTLTALPHPALD